MILKFRVYEQTISLQATKSEPRQGSKDYLELQFSFSSDWNDLLKYVYLQHGEVSVPHDLTEGSIIVDEYFTEQTEFNVTLFGKSADGSIEVPTNVVTVFLKESNNLWEKDAPAPQNSWVVQVIDARDEALAAAIRAENAAIRQPYPNSETDTWWVWDAASGAYKDTGVSAAGKSAYAYAVDGGYTGTETKFAKKLASEALIVHVTDNNGTLSADKSYVEIIGAIIAGIPVLVDYYGTDLTLIAISDSLFFGTIVCTNDDIGAMVSTTMIEITLNGEVNDISATVETMPNPNAITFTGAVTGNYDGSAAMTVNIPSAVTDEHINSLIDTKLGVIENGSY